LTGAPCLTDWSSGRRQFFLPSGLGRIIGKPLLYSLTNGWAKYYQVDTHRRPVEMTDEF
jgi:gamma-glutamylputrescine oxidase